MLITNLEHFLAPDGSIAPKEGPALRLADYLTNIVVSETTLCQSQPETMNVHVVDVLIENHVRERLIVILTQRLIKLFGGVRYVRNRVLSVTGKIRYGIAPTMLNYTKNGS